MLKPRTTGTMLPFGAARKLLLVAFLFLSLQSAKFAVATSVKVALQASWNSPPFLLELL